MSPEQHILALQAKFANAFGFVVFGSTTAGLLEKYPRRAVQDTSVGVVAPGPLPRGIAVT